MCRLLKHIHITMLYSCFIVYGVARYNLKTNKTDSFDSVWLGVRSKFALTVLGLHFLEFGTAKNLGAAC